ncbi:glycerophosphodiester phosphodiesterase [Fictibacillus barbaricus]|uniref:Glycerophosphodiester phosphodiesterase n=1 Tax=Fictibacillus barbaricus TaxID=182136 RepID=A0ABS2ZE82_9BACL|nr:glycerophosphodiester phosphodiesterase [Fictibacillus barbaricus]MBN3546255.1 glycerophosphodiester phosphodiesterase [Fictibacillus barbaricus]GGB39725.1 putative glycerophosphoryl diester phosphodiesterase YhdW [Fictibacillus barbaricus]
MNVRKTAVASILSMGILGSFFTTETFAYEPSDQVQTVAHRGASGYAPENTMAAFQKGVDMKADYIEIDVQQTKDGELVVIHDVTLDRTTDGTGYIKDHTLEQIRQLDAGSYFGEEFAGEKVPTFEEVLDEFRGKTGILIELKATYYYPGIEEKVASALKERNMHLPAHEKIIIQSFEFDSMQRMDKLLPEVPVGVLTSRATDLSEAKLSEFSTYAEYVNPSRLLVNSSVVDEVHERNMGIMAWTVRNEQEVQPLLDAGVDGIITDYPDYAPLHKAE